MPRNVVREKVLLIDLCANVKVIVVLSINWTTEKGDQARKDAHNSLFVYLYIDANIYKHTRAILPTILVTVLINK